MGRCGRSRPDSCGSNTGDEARKVAQGHIFVVTGDSQVASLAQHIYMSHLTAFGLMHSPSNPFLS